MLNLGRFILKRMLLDTEKLMFALPRMFPPSESKLTALRIKNFISSYLNWKFGLGLKSKPVILQVGPVRGCNLNCVMCGAGQLRIQKLPFDNFKKIIDNFPETMFINLNEDGEPFLSKDTLKMINYAQRKAIVIIFSNFTVLPSPEDIINSGLFEINASIDSFDKQKYSFIRKGNISFILLFGKVMENLKKTYPQSLRNQILKSKNEKPTNEDQNTFDIVVKNLKNLVDTRKKLKKKLPIISISAVFAKETKEDAEDIIKNAIDLGVDRVKFQKLAFDVPGVFHTPDPDDFFFLQKLKQKYKNQIEIIFANFDHTSELKGYCFHAYFMTFFDVFGNIFPCFMLPKILENTEFSKFGNIENTDIIKALERRQNFINNFRDNPPQFCKECYLYLRKS
jgi:MoaA/NifB/PqqE/SkfB family radical SAM enzyme